MSTDSLTPQNADKSYRNLTVRNNLVARNISASNVNLSTLNGESVADLLAGVDVLPGDDVQAALDRAAANLLPGTKGATVFLAIGEYPETSIIIPDGVNMAAYQPGATFPYLETLGFRDSDNGDGEYIITNVQFTVNNSNTDSIVTMPTLNTTTFIQLSGNASITSSATTGPLIAWDQASELDLTLRSGTSLTMTDPTKTVIDASSGTVYIDVLFGSSINGLTDINGTVDGVLTVGGTLNAGSDVNTSLDITTSGTFDLVNDYSTVIGQRDVSGLDTNVHKFGVLYDKSNDQVVLPTILFDSTVTTDTTTDYTITAADVVGGILVRTPGAASADVLPTSTLLVAEIPNAFIGSTLQLKIINRSGANDITLSAGSGGTLIASSAVIAANTSALVYIRITSIDGGSPTYVAYL